MICQKHQLLADMFPIDFLPLFFKHYSIRRNNYTLRKKQRARQKKSKRERNRDTERGETEREKERER